MNRYERMAVEYLCALLEGALGFGELVTVRAYFPDLTESEVYEVMSTVEGNLIVLEARLSEAKQ
jgi:hypothetical protein